MVKSLITTIEDEAQKRKDLMEQDLAAFKKQQRKNKRMLFRTASTYQE